MALQRAEKGGGWSFEAVSPSGEARGALEAGVGGAGREQMGGGRRRPGCGAECAQQGPLQAAAVSLQAAAHPAQTPPGAVVIGDRKPPQGWELLV